MTNAIRARNWFITINNYTDEDIKYLENYSCQYIIVGKEIGEECQTPHLHAYFELKHQKSFSKIKKEFPRAVVYTSSLLSS